jgi:RimJ/RimL family protein N-acetyltransferase
MLRGPRTPVDSPGLGRGGASDRGREEARTPGDHRRYDMVVIAASVGGVGALRTLLSALSADFPVTVAVVQHRTARQPNLLAKLLGRHAPLAVTMAEESATMRPGTVYLAPPDSHLIVRDDGSLGLVDGRKLRHVRSSANPLFSSAAAALRGRVIAVVLTGGGCYATDGVQPAGRESAAAIIGEARRAGRTVLDEHDSKRLLAAYGLPTVETRAAATEDEAVAAAEAIGFPVVVKLRSATIAHKTDVGGVRLRVPDADSVRHAYQSIESSVRDKVGAGHFGGVTVQPMVPRDGYELLIGSAVDPTFGPVLAFGTGGVLVEVYRDRAVALPPLNSTLARRLMERTRIFAALKGIRGRAPVDLAALEHLLVRFGRLIVEQPWIREIDINPLLASPERLVALDARVVLHGAETAEAELPRPAIRPYPAQYVGPWTLKDRTRVVIRPIRPEGEPQLVRFHEGLSERSIYHRYFNASKLSHRVRHERLTRNCFIDYDREMALVAEHHDPQAGAPEILGVGRFRKIPRTARAEFALVVADRHQRQGQGTELLRRLVRVGRDEGLHLLTALILPENGEMRRVCHKLGAELSYTVGSTVRADIDLTLPPGPAALPPTEPAAEMVGAPAQPRS